MDLFGIGPIADLAKEILAMFPNAEQRATAANKLQDLAAQIAASQSATNTAEAGNSSVFVSGWRPACGWLCIIALGYATIIAPVFRLPSGDMNTLIMILTGMLGLGTMRTVEKVKGVAR